MQMMVLVQVRLKSLMRLQGDYPWQVKLKTNNENPDEDEDEEDNEDAEEDNEVVEDPEWQEETAV